MQNVAAPCRGAAAQVSRTIHARSKRSDSFRTPAPGLPRRVHPAAVIQPSADDGPRVVAGHLLGIRNACTRAALSAIAQLPINVKAKAPAAPIHLDATRVPVTGAHAGPPVPTNDLNRYPVEKGSAAATLSQAVGAPAVGLVVALHAADMA